MSGVAMQRSKSILPPWTFSTRSSAPTMSAPAALASSALAPRANTATRTVRPVPFGRLTTPRTIWSAWRGSTPRFIATLDGLVELRLGAFLDQLHRLVERIELFAIDAFAAPCCNVFRCAHRRYPSTSRPIERAEPSIMRHRRFDRVAFRSFIFCSAISRTCALRHVAGDVAARESSSRFRASPPSSGSSDTGGVFISKVKERSG